MSPWLLNVYMDGSDKRGEDEDGKEWGEIPGGLERVEIPWPLVCR